MVEQVIDAEIDPDRLPLVAGAQIDQRVGRRGQFVMHLADLILRSDELQFDAVIPPAKPAHVVKHLSVMTELNKQGRYDRMTDDLFKLTGQKPIGMYDFVKLHAAEFTRA